MLTCFQNCATSNTMLTTPHMPIQDAILAGMSQADMFYW